MTGSEMNDTRHEDRDVDAAIDRAAKQRVMHEPPARMYAAVMADIQRTADERLTAWRWTASRWTASRRTARRRTARHWTAWQWTLAGVSAAALLAIALVVWNAHRPSQPGTQVASMPPQSPPPPAADVAKLAPPIGVSPALIPSSPPRSTRSTSATAVPALRRPAAEPLVGSSETGEPLASSSETGQPQTPPRQPQRPVEVNDIPMSAIPVPDIPISTIPVDMDQGDPILVSTIAVDSK